MTLGALQAGMLQSVSIENPTGSTNLEGAAGGYGAATVVQAQVSYGTWDVRNGEGDETVAHAIMMLPAGTTIGLTSRVTLPDSSQPRILKVLPISDPRSGEADHITVYLE